MLLLLACTDTVDDTAPAENDTDTDTDSDTDTDADSDSDSDTDTASDACSSTCDCADDDVCYDGTCATPGPAVHLYRATMARMLASMDESGGFDAESAYPTEAMISLASGAELLCDEELAAAATTRAEFARSWETDDHFLVWSGFPYITRDYQARHIYNLWAAGHALGDATLLTAADEAAAAMLTLERLPYKEDFTIFCAVYDVSTLACDTSTLWIDDNQNSEIGLAFALLTTDPSSALYGDALALDVVDQELRAAVSLQAATGQIPIGSAYGYEDDYDTLYGSYAAYSWTLAAPWTTVDLAPHLALAADWLAPMSGGDPISHRTYPYAYDGVISLSEGMMRLPLLSATGRLDPAFLDYWWDETIATNSETYSVFLPIWMATYSGTPLRDILPME